MYLRPSQGLYSKLIGKGNAGLYFAVLQSNGAISRVLAGQLVGLARRATSSQGTAAFQGSGGTQIRESGPMMETPRPQMSKSMRPDIRKMVGFQGGAQLSESGRGGAQAANE